ncbi:hypothetical protein K503DRAFT_801948 [Rhizopogon vinicolor AM-OR11-026]|uniref:Uncharacterized protein n=1 Tax=Rhizopogon vinicolor AM-OR11-026 TaxID=1314800 RepID=A0A1B7MVB0_9AGAM|nr:hypothetical protein K503DRAFT_801948 [Rhizopogon vinicolor AM-OR11-026]
MGKGLALSQLISEYLFEYSGAAEVLRFSSSILITVITIPLSIILLRPHTLKTLIFTHVKGALSLVICNLLVIVTFIYRVFCKEMFDLDGSFVFTGLFTSMVVVQYQSGTNVEPSTSVQEGAMKSKMEDEGVLSHDAEVGTSTQCLPEALKDGV